MKTFLIKVLMGLMKALNLIYRPLKLKNRVLITSRQSDEPTLDIRLLADRLKEDGIETEVLCKTLNKGVGSAISFAFFTLIQMKQLAVSKVVILDGYCIPAAVLPKKEGQSIIQMWHALGAIKKFGWQSVENPDGHSPEVADAMKMHNNYDFFLAPSKITGRLFSEGFRTDIQKVAYFGLPRIDFILKEDTEKREEIFRRYPQVKEKINVLYVPTFRKNAALEIEELIRVFDFNKFNFIIKKHFLDKGDYTWAKEAGAIVDEEFNSLEWIRICEKAVTDYSAIAFEAAIAGMQLYIYQPDADKYGNNTGINVDMKNEPVSDYVCYSEEELVRKLDEPYDEANCRAFREKYIEVNLNDCTGQFAGFVESLLQEETVGSR